MLFQTYGDRNHPAVLFFHAMGVTGESSEPVAKYLQDRYFCILPTSTVYCKGQKYVSKADEVRQVEAYLKSQGVEHLELVVASSIGADLAMAFLTSTKLPIGYVFFDGGQFAQIGKGTRRVMAPFLYLAIKSLYWSKGGTLKKILWCDDDSIKPYFIAAGENLTYTNLQRQLSDSLEDKPFPALSEELQKQIYFEFGSILPKEDADFEGKKYRRTCLRFFKLMCATSLGKLCASDHAMNAIDEMSALNRDLRKFFDEHGAAYPVWQELEAEAGRYLQ